LEVNKFLRLLGFTQGFPYFYHYGWEVKNKPFFLKGDKSYH